MSLWRFWKRVAAERARQTAEPEAGRQELQRDQWRRAKARGLFEKLEPLLNKIKASGYQIAVTDAIEISGPKGRDLCIRPVFEDEAAELCCDGTDFCRASREMQELGCVFHIDVRDSYKHHLPRPSGLCHSGEIAQLLVETLVEEITTKQRQSHKKWRNKWAIWMVLIYLLLVVFNVFAGIAGGPAPVLLFLLVVAFILLWAVSR